MNLTVRKLNENRLLVGICLLFIATLVMPVTVSHANLVPDPSFEKGTASTKLLDGASSIDSSVARTGSKSLKLKNDGAAKGHNAGQYGFGGVQAGTEYVYSVWVRGTDVRGHGSGGKPLTIVQWLDAGGNKLEKERFIWAPYGNYGWVQMKIHLQAPAKAAKANVSFRSWYDCLSGHTNWDDISLAPRNLSYRGSLTGTYQAESATRTSGGSIKSVEPGYTGSGYFHGTSDGAFLEWTNVSGGASGGKRVLAFRYAYEGNQKSWEVFVNGKSQGVEKPVATGRVQSWASFDWNVTLQPGNNTVRVKVLNVPAGELSRPNIDKMDVYAGGGGGTPTTVSPTITPDGGTFSSSVRVSLQTATEGATIYYTTNGSTPTTGSTRYTGPFSLTATTTVKAMAVATGYTNSAVVSATFTKSGTTKPTAATPTITPDGGTFSSSVRVSLQTATEGATIYYTTNGSTPTTGSTRYTGPFSLTATTTVKAMAVASGYKNSAMVSATFTKSGTTKPTAATPTITPDGGTFSSSVRVSLQTATEGATIYYTTNGSKPTTRSTKYTGAFTLISSATVKAIAVASGYTKSAVARAVFKKSTTSTGGQQPYAGKPWPVPGTINAEDYDKGGEGVAYHDRSAENKGGKYRTDGVDIYYSRDSLVKYYTGANASGEWLEYTVDVAKSGTYSLDLHVATPNSGRKVSVMLDGNEDITGSIDVPNTSGWHNWETVMTTVKLSAGKHVLRVVIDRGGFSLNWIDINPIGKTK